MLVAIPNQHPDIDTEVQLTAPFVGACPISGEPQQGSTITVQYRPLKWLLGMRSLPAYLTQFAEGDEAIDLETAVQRTARACAGVLDVPVTVTAHYILRDGLEMTCSSSTAPAVTGDLPR